jgi:hypothetical protein
MEDQIHSETENAEAESSEAVDNANEQDPSASAEEVTPQPQQTYHLPPGYAYDPASGQVFYVGPAIQQPVQPISSQPGVYSQPQQPDPEQVAAAQAASTQRYGQVINSVEQFLEGEATVSDVVKTLYTNTAQDDQLWKGIIVGAAAAMLLTSEPVRKAMGQTLGGVFPGLKQSKQTQQTAGTSTAAAENTTT